ncbi:hypothetical protein PMAC_001789 [Pneumocystis sp. 'macacae']|nr:hypothetical protein PMAC_001789 [Pneumocystis sp. 'macacae']
MGKGNKKPLNNDIWDELGEDIVPKNINKNNHNELQNNLVIDTTNFNDLTEEFDGFMSTLKASSENKPIKKENDSLVQNSKTPDKILLKQDLSLNKNGLCENNNKPENQKFEVPEIRLKTKREKEKEKKEREKAKKKTQSEIKNNADKLNVEKEKTKISETVKTKKQLNSPTIVENFSHESTSTKKTKAKIINIAALQKQIELRMQIEEERRKQQEEEKRIIEEEEKRIQEEEQKKREAKARKKEREKAKREELKSQGKFLTKKQKEQQQIAQIKIQQLLAAGVKIEGLANNIDSGSPNKPTRLVYDSKRKKSRNSIKNMNNLNNGTSFDVKFNNNVSENNTTEFSIQKDNLNKVLELSCENDIVDNWEETFKDEDNVIDSWEDAFDYEDDNKDSCEINTEDVNSRPSNEDSKIQPLKININDCIKKTGNINYSKIKYINTEVEYTNIEKEEILQDSCVKENKILSSKKDSKNIRNNLRSPICCILGHVDTGKTKILDKIRQTNVQEGEAGGITQQIGATYFPMDYMKQKISVLDKNKKLEYKVPGLLVIDTPGHESFTNLRSRGSSLCDIAILVVDIMHGLERQTLESLRLLKDRKTPFIVALNKIDRIYGWDSIPDGAFQESLLKQKKSVQREYHDRYTKTVVEFSEQGLNAVAYYDNKNFAKNVSIVPTSALTGEGIPDMLMLLINLTQQRMSNKLMYLSKLEATVLEVKVVEGLGTTIDVILSNGVLKEGDRIVLCGLNGAIATNIRALLTPQPLKELRIKSTYLHNKEVKAASGVKISANDLDKAIAGSRLMVVGPNDNEEEMKEEVMKDLHDLLNFIDTSGIGVSVQASTLGSLEALLEFLKQNKIPVSSINIGPVHKKDVMKCSVMIEKAKEYTVMLCFDVKIDKDAEELAEQLGVKIFAADIIYHLFDSFIEYQAKIMESKRQENASEAVFPCVLKTIAVFNKKDPILLGVEIIEGVIRVGTPICAIKINSNTQERHIVDLGRVASIEKDHKVMNVVKKEQASKGVAIRIESASQILFGRQVDEKDTLYSHISRKSIDILKGVFRDEVSKEEWNLIRKLKTVISFFLYDLYL